MSWSATSQRVLPPPPAIRRRLSHSLGDAALIRPQHQGGWDEVVRGEVANGTLVTLGMTREELAPREAPTEITSLEEDDGKV
jgi:hypothetical protein